MDLTVQDDNKTSVEFLLVYRGLNVKTVCSLPLVINNFRRGTYLRKPRYSTLQFIVNCQCSSALLQSELSIQRVSCSEEYQEKLTPSSNLILHWFAEG